MTLVDEWIDKAEGDYRAAVVLNGQRKTPVPDSVCNHCQQCAEKYLKAHLIYCGVASQRTHESMDLLTKCCSYEPSLAQLAQAVRLLSPYSVQFRYPGDSANAVEATTAIVEIRSIRRVLRKRLGLT